MSVASFDEEYILRESSSPEPRCWCFSLFALCFTFVWLNQTNTCSRSSPSGNLVGGLPLVANTELPANNTGEDSIGPEPHP